MGLMNHLTTCVLLVTITECASVHSCLEETRVGNGGIIESPNYPYRYLADSCLTWYLQGSPGSAVYIRVLKLDLPQHGNNSCRDQLLLGPSFVFPTSTHLSVLELCRPDTPLAKGYFLEFDKVWIRLMTTEDSPGGRFLLKWTLIEGGGSQVVCNEQQFQCRNAKCVPQWYRCNGEDDCEDGVGSDELGCPPRSTSSPPTRAIQTLPPLPDYSDCPDLHFKCRNSRCIPLRYRCDGVDNCNDGVASDELWCPSRSASISSTSTSTRRTPPPVQRIGPEGQTRIILAAVAGSLVCSLLLVLALGCSCKVYALRSAPQCPPRRMESPLTRIQAELFRRRAPPPPYSEAMRTSRSYDEVQREYLAIMRSEGRLPGNGTSQNNSGNANNAANSSTSSATAAAAAAAAAESGTAAAGVSVNSANTPGNWSLDRSSSTTQLIPEDGSSDSDNGDSEGEDCPRGLGPRESVQLERLESGGGGGEGLPKEGEDPESGALRLEMETEAPAVVAEGNKPSSAAVETPRESGSSRQSEGSNPGPEARCDSVSVDFDSDSSEC